MQKRKVNVVTMGCSKNLVDSEVLMNQLEGGGWEVVHDAGKGRYDAVVINTCGFIHDAKQESVDMILAYAEAKVRGEVGRLYVMGCLSGRYGRELAEEIPEVDRFFGKFDMAILARELQVTFRPENSYQRKLTTPAHYAYLKVSEGCNRSCGFCAIPGMTGRYHSRPMEELVKETEFLAGKGVRELLLIAQDLSYYGTDLYGRSSLAELAASLSEAAGIEWIRLHYFYPSRFPGDILPLMRTNRKVCPYLDLPLQHIADPVLKRMLRRTTRRDTEALIRRVRKEVPGVALRTTFLLGYPGETDNDFSELVRFVQNTRFDRLGVFPYSHEEGTYAFSHFTDDVPGEVKQSRMETLMEIQQAISRELNEEKVGTTCQVIIDRKEWDYWIGRTSMDSPEVDGEVFIESAASLLPGQFVWVKITGAGDYDLYAEYERPF